VNLVVDTGSSNLAVAGPDTNGNSFLETFFIPEQSNTFSSLNDTHIKLIYSEVRKILI